MNAPFDELNTAESSAGSNWPLRRYDIGALVSALIPTNNESFVDALNSAAVFSTIVLISAESAFEGLASKTMYSNERFSNGLLKIMT
jgi:hypothetical protein